MKSEDEIHKLSYDLIKRAVHGEPKEVKVTLQVVEPLGSFSLLVPYSLPNYEIQKIFLGFYCFSYTRSLPINFSEKSYILSIFTLLIMYFSQQYYALNMKFLGYLLS